MNAWTERYDDRPARPRRRWTQFRQCMRWWRVVRMDPLSGYPVLTGTVT